MDRIDDKPVWYDEQCEWLDEKHGIRCDSTVRSVKLEPREDVLLTLLDQIYAAEERD